MNIKQILPQMFYKRFGFNYLEAHPAADEWVYPVGEVLPLPKNNCKVIFDIEQEYNPEDRGRFDVATGNFYGNEDREYPAIDIKRYAIINDAQKKGG